MRNFGPSPRRLGRVLPTGAGLILIALAAAVLAAKAPKTPPAPAPALFWPPAPDVPRIRYLGQAQGPADLGIRQGLLLRVLKGVAGSAPAERFQQPQTLASDGPERLIVTDTGLGRAWILDLAKRKSIACELPSQQGRLVAPVGAAVDQRHRVFITDSESAVIYVFDGSGKWETTIKAELRRPTGIAYDRGVDRFFVVDTIGNEIAVLDPQGKRERSFGRRGVEDGQLNYPTYLAVDHRGRVLVVDSMNFRVQIFNRDGGFVRKFGQLGEANGTGLFFKPKGIALDSEGHVYVVDSYFDVVQIFDQSGAFLLSFGQSGPEPGMFWLPTGIMIDAADTVYVADSKNHRLQMFQYLPVAEKGAKP